ncbi:hypothetical protein [Thermococcus gammatolerans]|uniref:HEAT repeat domain-containing protein n=1 Tax=Thermococcus gammatolerans (strain DSM 15229 / JCM 11827 / EJ3) TaxID=593117 RepID=C5A5V2_THEGJ|nr:hypothetical protein [Thermococcus gammatolerans]ACS33614.1 Conserved hypothetical protein [Thermococcus gammatolerans EJ3]
MAFFSFGSKKGKVKKMLESDQIQMVVEDAARDKKVREALFELLQDSNPGIVGDALLTLTMVMDSNPDVIKPHLNEETVKRLLGLVESRNPYVRENAMILLYRLAKDLPDVTRKYWELFMKEAERVLREGDLNQKGFMLVLIGEFGIKELEGLVKEFVNVEDKVILPFEGKRWVKLGDIAKETLEKLV